MTRARYTIVAMRGDLVAIKDDFDGADPTMSVTNDIEAVVADLVGQGIIKPPRLLLIYRDTEGFWDRVIIETQYPHSPVAFSPLREKSLEAAIAAARRPLLGL